MNRLSGRQRIGLFAIALLAAALRIAAIVYTHAVTAPAEENRIIARNFAAGRGFTFTEFGVTGPTAVRGPIYPMLLALVGPDRMKLILAINVLAAMATVYAIFALTRRLLAPAQTQKSTTTSCTPTPVGSGSSVEEEPDPTGVGVQDISDGDAEFSRQRKTPPHVAASAARQSRARTRASWIAAITFAICPTQLYAATLTQGLTFAVLLLLTTLALAFRRTAPSILVAGVLAGVAALTEPVLALPLLLVSLAIGWRKQWGNAVLFVLTAIVVVTPWLYRNAVVFGGPMPITSNFWRDAFLGNGPDANGTRYLHLPQMDKSGRGPNDRRTRIETLAASDFDRLKVPEPQRVAVYREWTTRWIRANVGEYMGLCISRPFGVTPSGAGHPLAGRAAFRVPFYVWCSAIGLFFICTDRRVGLWLGLTALLWIGVALTTAFSLGEARNAVLIDAACLPALAIVLGKAYVPRSFK